MCWTLYCPFYVTVPSILPVTSGFSIFLSLPHFQCLSAQASVSPSADFPSQCDLVSFYTSPASDSLARLSVPPSMPGSASVGSISIHPCIHPSNLCFYLSAPILFCLFLPVRLSLSCPRGLTSPRHFFEAPAEGAGSDRVPTGKQIYLQLFQMRRYKEWNLSRVKGRSWEC